MPTVFATTRNPALVTRMKAAHWPGQTRLRRQGDFGAVCSLHRGITNGAAV
ncbi:hypothetical protein C7S13_7458 [Burkholderia cepacia]|nr:hypothetical protein [Burkholderia cepacia]